MSGGIVFRAEGALHFLPGSVALKVVPLPSIAQVPGASDELLGIALVEGAVVPVVSVGKSRSCLLLCAYLGERVGLVGVEVVGTGRFETRPGESLHVEDVVAFGGVARLFDMSAVVAGIQNSRRAV